MMTTAWDRLRDPDDFRGTVKMFSKSLKEASDCDNIGGGGRRSQTQAHRLPGGGATQAPYHAT